MSAIPYQFRTLKNNLRVGIAPISHANTATLLISFKAGSKYENKEENGVSHFIEHMLFKGTEKRPVVTQIVREIERLGGDFNGYTVRGFTWFYIKLLKEDIDIAINVLSDAVLNSLFLEEELERERRVLLEEINIYNDSPDDLISDLFEKCLYGDHPLGRSALGDPKIIKEIRVEELKQFFNKYYVASNAVVTAAGNIEVTPCLNTIENYFESMEIGTPSENITAVQKQSEPKLLIQKKTIGQIRLALGVRTFPINHPDHHVTKLIAIILGGNMSTRLFQRAREELGLVYDITCETESKTGTGYLVTYTGLQRNNAVHAIETVLKEYQRLTSELASEEELQDAKNFLLSRKKILSEDSYYTALDLAKKILFDKKELTFEDYKKNIEKITPEQIMQVAKIIFKDENLNLAIVGPVTLRDRSKYKKILHF